MKCLSGLGIGLSLVLGCILLALIAELYHVLWWKRRLNRVTENESNGSSRELFCLFCGKKPSFLNSAVLNPQQSCCSVGNQAARNVQSDNQHPVSSKAASIEPFEKEGIESELMRVHNLSGPPRFLFTIEEETREDLESEDGSSRKSIKRSRRRSLSDFSVAAGDTPFGTPLSSPPFFTPPLTPRECYRSFSGGFNPLFESSMEAELSRLRSLPSSPPPKFKFMRDAEEKLCRRIMEAQRIHSNSGVIADEVNRKINKSSGLVSVEEMSNPSGFCGLTSVGREGSFLTIIINKNAESHHQTQHPTSGSSLVLPLQSSPPENATPGTQKSIDC